MIDKNREIGPSEPEEIPGENSPDGDYEIEDSFEMHDEEKEDYQKLQREVDERREEIEERYQRRTAELQKYEKLMQRESGLSPEEFEGELRSAQSSNELLDELLQAIYQKREEIKKDRNDAMIELTRKIKSEIEEI